MEQTIRPDPIGTVIFPRVIDNTMYSDWRACHHRWFRRHGQGLAKERLNVHLHFGGCFAAAMEKGRLSFLAGADHSDYVKDACEFFIERWGNFEIPDYATQSERNKSLANGVLAVQEYFAEWPLEDDDLEIYVHTDGKPAVEFSGAALIPGSRHPDTGEPIIYCGRFDMIGRRGKHSLRGLDDKTTSSLGEHWRNQWLLRSQFTGYVWLASEYHIPLDGFEVRGTCILKGGTKFDTVSVACPPWKVQRWLAQLCHDVNVMCEQYETYKKSLEAGLVEHPDLPHPFGRDLDHACSDFNGCAYIELCNSEHPDTWLSEFVVDRWNPLDRQGA